MSQFNTASIHNQNRLTTYFDYDTKNTKEESLFVQLFLCPQYYHYLDRKGATVVKRNSIKMSQVSIAKVFLKSSNH